MVVAHHQFSSKMDLIKSLIRFLIMVPPVFVLIGAVTLSLLGFGVALAIESVFGVPRGMTYDSPLDLFNLGGHVIAGGLEFLDGWRKSAQFRLTALSAMYVGIAISALWLVCRGLAGQKRTPEDDGNCRSASRIPGLNTARRFGYWLFKEKLCLVPVLLVGSIPWLCAFSMAFVLVLFSWIPLMGYDIAKEYLHGWIVGAEHCAPVSSRQERLSMHNRNAGAERKSSEDVRITPCLSLWKGGTMIAEGRHVVSTDKYIILFDPVTGGVQLEPTDGVTVRVKGASVSELYRLIDRIDTEE
ncbi:hypothetical protein [Achromobacter sp. MYb9]|uniref:hypothetical protein n=1 Tax=Achromobacter sp. MYb9 TaxID=1827284 RepID=UPI0011B28276|nr:hypothetical protein [Achromobacter sp. MYb9]